MLKRFGLILSFVIGMVLLAGLSALLQAQYNANWEASSGLFSEEVCPAWQLNSDADPEIPTFQDDSLVMTTWPNSEIMIYQQIEPLLAFPETLTLEFRMRYVSGTITDPTRTSCTASFLTGSRIGNLLFIGQDEIFLLASYTVKGDQATVDTDDDFHTYRMEVTQAGTISVFYDDSLTLTGTTFYHYEWVTEQAIGWGDHTRTASGTAKWLYFRHNAFAFDQDSDGDGIPDFCEGGDTVFSSSDPYMVLSPAGNMPFRVTLKDNDGLPVQGSTNARLDFSEVSGLTPCPSQSDWPIIWPSDSSDVNGIIEFHAHAGGCSADSVKVMSSHGQIAKVPIKSLDHNGGLRVTITDFVGDECNDYNNDGVTDGADWDFFTDYLGQDCIDNCPDYLNLYVYTIPGPHQIYQGDTIQVCAKVVNTLKESVVLDSVLFKTAGWGIARPWTSFAQSMNVSLDALDTIILCREFVVPPSGHGCFKVEIYPDCDLTGVGRKRQINVDARRRPPGFWAGLRGMSSPIMTKGLDVSTFAIPIGTESGDSLQLYEFTFLPDGWSYAVSDSGWIYTPDTLWVDVFHDSVINEQDTGRVIFYAYNAAEEFAGYSEVSVYSLNIRGDANGDGQINIADAVYLINYLFTGGTAPDPLWVGDCNCDDIVNIADVVYLVNYLFTGGEPPGC